MTAYHINVDEHTALLPSSTATVVEDLRVDRRRRLTALTFASLISMQQGLVWLCLSSIALQAKAFFPALTDGDMDLMLNWAAMAFVPGVPICIWLLSFRHGLRIIMVTASILSAIATIIRIIVALIPDFHKTNACLYFLHAAAFLNGCSGPLVFTAPSSISAYWFPLEQRSLATAIAQLMNNFGPALGFLLALPVVLGSDVPYLLGSEAIFATLLALGCIFFFPAEPIHPPSVSAQQHLDQMKSLSLGQSKCQMANASLKTYFSETWIACKNLNFVLFAVGGGFAFGIYNVWSASLVQVLGTNVSDNEAKWLALGTHFTGIFGSLCIGYFVEKWFARRVKPLMIVLYVLALACYIWFTLSLPSGFADGKTLLPSNTAILGISTCFAAFFLSATFPLVFETAGEMTYPLREGISAGFIGMTVAVAALILLFTFPHIPEVWDNAFTVISVTVSLLAICCVRFTYQRRTVDQHDGGELKHGLQ